MADVKKPSIWKKIGLSLAELLGNAIYKGPR